MLLGAALYLRTTKFGETDEQRELRHYVVDELPVLIAQESAIHHGLDRLDREPLTAVAARTLLVNQLVPQLLTLQKQAGAIVTRSATLKELKQEYLRYIDQLIDACRTSIRTIDDPSVSPAEGLRRVRSRFYEAGKSSQAWSAHLRQACVPYRPGPTSR